MNWNNTFSLHIIQATIGLTSTIISKIKYILRKCPTIVWHVYTNEIHNINNIIC